DRAAGADALAVRLAARHVDLVVVADRVLRTGAHAGIAARAEIEIDRVLLPPCELEGAEPARELGDAAGPYGVLALERQLAAAARDEDADAELGAQPLGPPERRGRRPNDEHVTRRLELHRRRGLGLRQRRHTDER